MTTSEISPAVINSLNSDWNRAAQEKVSVEIVGNTIYGFGSELAVLRIMMGYRKQDNARVGFSAGYGLHFFALDVNL